jgi:hypothetical protein
MQLEVLIAGALTAIAAGILIRLGVVALRDRRIKTRRGYLRGPAAAIFGGFFLFLAAALIFIFMQRLQAR